MELFRIDLKLNMTNKNKSVFNQKYGFFIYFRINFGLIQKNITLVNKNK